MNLKKLKNRLNEISTECALGNWDGYNASTIKQETLDRVFEYLRSLPDAMPDPDIAPDPDGEISLEWYVDKDHLFSISINAEGRLAYAGLFGSIDIFGKKE